jgi:hypothetical protein
MPHPALFRCSQYIAPHKVHTSLSHSIARLTHQPWSSSPMSTSSSSGPIEPNAPNDDCNLLSTPLQCNWHTCSSRVARKLLGQLLCRVQARFAGPGKPTSLKMSSLTYPAFVQPVLCLNSTVLLVCPGKACTGGSAPLEESFGSWDLELRFCTGRAPSLLCLADLPAIEAAEAGRPGPFAGLGCACAEAGSASGLTLDCARAPPENAPSALSDFAVLCVAVLASVRAGKSSVLRSSPSGAGSASGGCGGRANAWTPVIPSARISCSAAAASPSSVSSQTQCGFVV